MKKIGSLRPVANQDGDILQPGGTIYTPTVVPVIKQPITPIVEPIVTPTTGTQGPFTDASGNQYWIINGTKTYYIPNYSTPVTPIVTPTPVSQGSPSIPVNQDGDILQPGEPIYTPNIVPVIKQPIEPIVTPTTGTQGPFTDASGNQYWIVNGTKTYYNPNPSTPVTPIVTPTPVSQGSPSTPVTPIVKPTPVLPDFNPIPMTTTDQTTNPIAGYTYCAEESQSYDFGKNIVDVAYGANGKFMFMDNVTGIITFNNATFGDPNVGVNKQGYYKIVTPATTTPAPVTTTPTYTPPWSVSPTPVTPQGTTLQEAPVTTDNNGNVVTPDSTDTTQTDATIPATTTTPATTTASKPTMSSKWLWIGGGALALWWLFKK